MRRWTAPMGGRLSTVAYQFVLDALSTHARRRYRHDFALVERFCLFVGYPRSGHSIVGATVNAHRDAVISHELDVSPLVLGGWTKDQLYSSILARAYWFNLRGNTTNYSFDIPNQWQGRFDTLRVIGDKRGGAVTRTIAEHPGFLDRLRALVGVPLRLVHVVRNPFDNIAAISIWHTISLEQSADFYFSHCRTTGSLGAVCDPSELITIVHEQLIRDPRTVLSQLCSFLGLEPHPGYVEDCSSVVFDAPSHSRSKVSWSPSLVREVERRASAYPFLAGYGFEVPR